MTGDPDRELERERRSFDDYVRVDRDSQGRMRPGTRVDLRLDDSEPELPGFADKVRRILDNTADVQVVEDPFEAVSGRPGPEATLEERVAYLERMNYLLWKAVMEKRGAS